MNHVRKIVLFTFLIPLFLANTTFAQKGKFDVQFQYVSASCNPKKVQVKAQVRASHTDSTFYFGDANLRFNFNTAQVDNPVIKVHHNFSILAPASDLNYALMNLTINRAGSSGLGSINISYTGSLSNAKFVTTDWIDIATIEFDLVASDNCFGLTWNDNTTFPMSGISQVFDPTGTWTTKEMLGKLFTGLNSCTDISLPSATLVASPTSITSGSSSSLTVNLTSGKTPWSATLSNGLTITNETATSKNLTVTPTATTTYTINSVTDACGTTTYSTNKPTATVTVNQVSVCNEKCVPISYKILGKN